MKDSVVESEFERQEQDRKEWQGFLGGLVGHWHQSASGIAGSLLLAGAVRLVGGPGAEVTPWLYWLIVTVGLLWASFVTWREQHRLVRQLQNTLEVERAKSASTVASRRRLRVECGSNVVGSVTPSIGDGRGFRIRVVNDGDTVHGCQGKLVSITFDGKSVWAGNPAPLSFCRAEDPDTNNKTIHHDQEEWLDVVFVLEHTKGDWFPQPGTVSRRWPDTGRSFEDLFDQYGDYILCIAVTAPGLDTLRRNYKFSWRGQADKCALELFRG